MDSSISFQDNYSQNKNMTYFVILIVIFVVVLFLIYVFSQGDNQKSFNLKSLFNKNNESKKLENEEEEENAEQIVNKNITEDNNPDKCKSKIYKKLGGNVCKGKYIPPL